MFNPFVYQPRLAGPDRPSAAVGLQQPLPQPSRGVVVPVSRAILLDDYPINPPATAREVKLFTVFPGDMVVEKWHLSWSKTRNGQSSQAIIQVSVVQCDRDQVETDIFETATFFESTYGDTATYDPVNPVRANLPLMVKLRLVNSIDPTPIAWWEDADLELWSTLHFISANIA